MSPTRSRMASLSEGVAFELALRSVSSSVSQANLRRLACSHYGALSSLALGSGLSRSTVYRLSRDSSRAADHAVLCSLFEIADRYASLDLRSAPLLPLVTPRGPLLV